MARPSHTTAPLLALLLAWGCDSGSSTQRSCESLDAPERDRCLADRAMDPALSPQDHHAAALGIQDPELRDLALAQAATGLGLDACDPIQDPLLRSSCQARTRRPHLDIPEPPEHSAGLQASTQLSLSEAEREAQAQASRACADQPAGLRDLCLQRQAGREQALLSWVACTDIQDDALRGDCAAQAATRLGAAEHTELATKVCASLEDPRWRGECLFRLSEAMPLAQVEASAQACLSALGFEDECLKHLIQRQAQASALRARFGTAQETMAGMALDLGRLDSAIDTQPAAPWLRDLFWYEAFHALLAEALQQDRLANVAALGNHALAGDGRLDTWMDCSAKLCSRAAAQQAEPLDLAALVEVAARCTDVAGGVTAPISLLSPSAPGSRFGELATSEVPAPIQPASGCGLYRGARTTIAALWGLEQLDWAHSQQPVEQALAHPDATIRAYTLDMVEHKAFFWQRQDRGGQQWLAQRLHALAQDDPSQPIRERAAVLATALDAGERPGRWAFHSAGVCGGAP